MFKNFYILITMVAVLAACSPKQPEGGFILHGKIANFEDQYLYYPKGYEMIKDVKLDSVFVENGQFSLAGKVDKPGFFRLASKDFKDFFVYVVLENSEINIEADAASGSKNNYNLHVKGSKSDSINKAFRIDFEKAIYKDRPGIKPEKRDQLIADFEKRILEYPDNIISLYAACDMVFYLNTGDNMHHSIEKIVEALEPHFKNTKQYAAILKFSNGSKLRSKGKKFVDFRAHQLNEEEVNLDDLLGKGYILVDCWASWCGPCRTEMPLIRDMYRKYKNQGFQVLSYSFDSDKKLWKEAIEFDKIEEFINVSELKHYDNTLANTYRINSIPDNFLLDNEGRIVANGLRGQRLINVLDSIYNRSLVRK
jgi:thiol-disulfide isomerase/thioredoxin